MLHNADYFNDLSEREFFLLHVKQLECLMFLKQPLKEKIESF